jgi:hypothetical protein
MLGALYARACGRRIVCVSACGMLKLPPSVWQSLWWRAMPTDPRHRPQSHALYCAAERAARSDGEAITMGSDVEIARMPSIASSEEYISRLNVQDFVTPEDLRHPTGGSTTCHIQISIFPNNFPPRAEIWQGFLRPLLRNPVDSTST